MTIEQRVKRIKEYRDHAEELRVVSTMMCSDSCRAHFIQIANDWEGMAADYEKMIACEMAIARVRHVR